MMNSDAGSAREDSKGKFASESVKKWGVPGGKKARKRAKDSYDGGPVLVANDAEVFKEGTGDFGM